ncbi:STAS domain-containing protein [Desulforhabdus amnigena]|jgi:anti-sigma B factor antagonist|uniref:Anti-sigma factor antagonist n=1 Tax=Desulforhabdus amnigena TaxID=40218 RepID=A0A9W6FTV8_9BACT|nr:STAS domain-containing protein [Desulforhabdus amnigena]NLJ29360.1 STAS domain-containing protein [Deltaproteobacteria bacterium]GLI34371.1 anti-sigma factor antagonist [Desulforhabdus amnigena]
MDVLQKRRNDVIILLCRGRLDANTSPEFEKELFDLIRKGESKFVLDFQDLDYISSAGLRVLLKAAKTLKSSEGQISFSSLKDYVREVFEISGFDTIFRLHATQEEALNDF